MGNDKTFKHESYGLVAFSHRSGNPKLFHSALENHSNYITLQIKTCSLVRSEEGDRLQGPMNGDLLEVDLSASQFAELLTTMNIGVGTACTIRRLNNKQVEPPPDIDSQPENMRVEVKAKAKSFAEKILARAGEVRELLKKPALNKSDRASILNVIDTVAMELKENMPFMVTLYQEATEKIINSAKAEIEGFMVSAIRQAGLQALAAGKVQVEPPQLPAITVKTTED